MNVPKPIPLKELKVGELYFEESELEEDSTHKKFYMFAIIKIKKIKKIQLKPDQKKLINYSYSFLENYSIFSEIIDFDTILNFSSDTYNFFETRIQTKNTNNSKYYFYNFDEEWFFKNKEVLLSHMNFSILDRPFQEVFQEIESEKK